MPAYRLYYLDDAGKVTRGIWIAADDDEQAIAAARKHASAVRCELWDRDRLVVRVEPDRPEVPPG